MTMILVHRICRLCGRKFTIQHQPGDNLPDRCPDCQ